jgi:LysR family glycine cleavage system transcriptional activator
MSEIHGWTVMSRRLPPLNGLRAFEAAARHLSFTRAADELNVTQTAISHQIRSLEERLGVRLFRRLPRGLVLTEEAQLYLPPIRDAFDQIAAATERLNREQTGGVLTVSMLPSFAARWLVPRLGRFHAAHPDIDLRITASVELVDFARDDVDVGIRRGRGDYPGLWVRRLFGESVYLVCTPALLEGPHGLRKPHDLRHHTLLHDDDTSGWRLWLELAGVEGVDAKRGPIFSDSGMLLQAAVEGHGVALGRSVLVSADLAAGRLVRPFDEVSMPFQFAYYFVCPHTHAERPKVVALRDWLLQEAAADAS